MPISIGQEFSDTVPDFLARRLGNDFSGFPIFFFVSPNSYLLCKLLALSKSGFSMDLRHVEEIQYHTAVSFLSLCLVFTPKLLEKDNHAILGELGVTGHYSRIAGAGLVSTRMTVSCCLQTCFTIESI